MQKREDIEGRAFRDSAAPESSGVEEKAREAVDACLECAHYTPDPSQPDRCIYWDDCDLHV